MSPANLRFCLERVHKYNLDEQTISQASKLDQWAFLLLHAQDYDAANLKRLLPGIEFETAINTIQVISEKAEDKQMYDQREKAKRDFEWAIAGAREEGREEGNLVGKIQLLQELLGEPVNNTQDLSLLTKSQLSQHLNELQQRLRERQA